MISAIELIRKERYEQVNKHGFSAEHDDEYEEGELEQIAIWLLTGDDSYLPVLFDADMINKMSKKSDKEKKIIAGALIAASIDSYERKRIKQDISHI